jgi:hypothetical protein
MTTKIATLIAAASLISASMFGVTFGTPAVTAGTSWTETSRYGSSIDIVTNNGMSDSGRYTQTRLAPAQGHQQTTISRTKTLTVLAMQGQRIGSVDVYYGSVEVNGADLTSRFSRHYVISLNGSHVSGVAHADGTSLTDAEADFVTSDNSNIGQFREVSRTFGGATVGIGDSLRSNNPDDLFDVQSGFSVDSSRITLSAVTGGGDTPQSATFDVLLVVSSDLKKPKDAPANAEAPFGSAADHGTSSLRMTLNGTLVADVATGRIQTFSLSGPVIASGSKDAHGKAADGSDLGMGKKAGQVRRTTMSASGSASLSATFTYSQ